MVRCRNSTEKCKSLKTIKKHLGYGGWVLCVGLDNVQNFWGMDKNVQPPDIFKLILPPNYVQPPENFQFDVHLCPDIHLCL